MASLSSNSSDEKSSKRSSDDATTSNTNSIEYKSVCRFFHLLPERQFVQQGFEPSTNNNPMESSSSEKDIKVVKNKMTPKSQSSESPPSQANTSGVSFPQRSKSLNITSPRAPRPRGRSRGLSYQYSNFRKTTTAKLASQEYFEGIYIGNQIKNSSRSQSYDCDGYTRKPITTCLEDLSEPITLNLDRKPSQVLGINDGKIFNKKLLIEDYGRDHLKTSWQIIFVVRNVSLYLSKLPSSEVLLNLNFINT